MCKGLLPAQCRQLNHEALLARADGVHARARAALQEAPGDVPEYLKAALRVADLNLVGIRRVCERHCALAIATDNTETCCNQVQRKDHSA